MKRNVLLILLAFCVAVMAGCGGGANSNGTTTKDGLKAAVLTAKDLRLSFTLAQEGQKLLMGRKYDEAMAKFEESLKINPVNSNIYIGIAEIYMQKDKDSAKALEALDKGLALDPGSNFILQRKGMLLIKEKKFEDALGAFKKALENDPGNTRLMYAMSMCYDKMGKAEKSDVIFEEAIKKDPNNHELYKLYTRHLRNRVRNEKDKKAQVAILRKLEPVLKKEMETYKGKSKYLKARYDYQMANNLYNIWDITKDSKDKELVVSAMREFIKKYKDKREGFRQLRYAADKLKELTGEEIKLPKMSKPSMRRKPVPRMPMRMKPGMSNTMTPPAKKGAVPSGAPVKKTTPPATTK